MNKRAVGDEAEAFAHGVIEREGYRIIELNAQTKLWELDVVAWEDDVLCFIEVRSTATLEFGGPLATVGPSKQRRVVRGASAWLAYREDAPLQTPWPPYVRFDVLGIWGPPNAREFELVRGAFDAQR